MTVQELIDELAAGVRDGQRVTYEGAWWDGNSRKSEWLEQFEVTRREESSAMKIGFV